MQDKAQEPVSASESGMPAATLPRVQRDEWGGLGVVYLRLDASTFPEHQHRQIQVSVPVGSVSAEARWRTTSGELRQQRVHPGEACVIPSSQPHTVWWDRETELVAFELDREFVTSAAHESLSGWRGDIVEKYGADDSAIRMLSLALQAEFHGGLAFGRVYLESLATVLAVHLVKHYAAGQTVPVRLYRGGLTKQRLRRATEFMAEHLQRDVTLGEIANAVGVSRFHFARQLKQSTGFAPHQYLVQMRIERAKQLLSATTLPIIEIAHATGFRAQSHFTAVFRRHVGVTPGQFRRES